MSVHSRITAGFGLVAFFVLLAKISGAAKEMAIAYRFGVSAIVDIYTLAFTIIALLPMVWTGVLVTVFVPMVKKVPISARDDFVRELNGFTLTIGGSLTIIFYFLFPSAVPFIWNEYSESDQKILVNMVMGLMPMMLMLFGSGLLAAQLLALEKHSNSLLDAIPSLVIAFVILVVPTSVEPSFLMVYSTLIGLGLQLAGLYILQSSAAHRPKVTFGFQSSSWRVFKNAFGIMVISNLVMGFIIPLDLFFASQLGTGQVATFGYANRLLLLFLGLGATAVSRAILPVLSDIQESDDKRKLAVQWSRWLFLLGCVVVVLAWVTMPLVVKLIFERGAFTAEDTKSVTAVIRYGLLQLPFYFGGIVLVQLFASEGRFIEIGISSVIAILVKIVFGFIGANMSGLQGLMLSTVLMYVCNCIYFVLRLRVNSHLIER